MRVRFLLSCITNMCAKHCEHAYAFIEKKKADWLPFRKAIAKYYRCVYCNKEKIEYEDVPKKSTG